MASFEKEREDMSADYQKAYDETSKLHDASADKTLSDQARADKQKAFEQKVQDLHNMERKIQEFNQTRQKQFEDQRLRMRAGIVDEITKYIADLGTREKYTFIYDKSGLSSNGVSLLVYVSPDLRDLTDDVIKALNASKPAGSASAPAAPAPAATTPAAPAAKP
jgi:outer membrane protein